MTKPEYLTIKQLAAHLNLSEMKTRWLAKSQRLRSIKGAVLDTNARKGKYEILRVNVHAAEKVYETYYKGITY